MPPSGARYTTYPYVWLVFVRMLPILGVIALVGVMGLKGSLTSFEAVMGFALAILGHSRSATDEPKGGGPLLGVIPGILWAIVSFVGRKIGLA